MLNPDSSDSDASSDDDHRGDPRNKNGSRPSDNRSAGSSSHPKRATETDAAERVKEVALKEFQKIVVRRRELCKWIEHAEY